MYVCMYVCVCVTLTLSFLSASVLEGIWHTVIFTITQDFDIRVHATT